MSSPHHHSGSLKIAFILNLSFTIIELIGGLLTNSIAILSDAIHDLGDSLSLGLALYSEHVAEKKPADEVHTYGHKRFTLFSALINTVVLIIGSTIILMEAIPRLLNPEEPHIGGMIGFAVLGIAVNGYATLKTSYGQSLNEKVVSWHLLEDVLGWAGVLVGSIVIYYTKWNWIDPLLAIGISSFILFNIVKRLQEIYSIFMQYAPPNINVKQIEKDILKNSLVESIHHLHVWSIDGEKAVMSVHVVVPRDSTKQDYLELKGFIKSLNSKYDLDNVTVEIEFGNNDCSMD